MGCSVGKMESMSRFVPVICRLSCMSIADLVEIEDESSPAPWSRNLFAQEFSNKSGSVFGARVQGKLVGFLICRILGDTAHIMNVAVRTHCRRRGIGRELLAYSLREFYAHGVAWATLEVRASNSAAQRLYESLGFREVGGRERYYSDNNEDAVIMNLDIRQFIDEFGDEAKDDISA